MNDDQVCMNEEPVPSVGESVWEFVDAYERALQANAAESVERYLPSPRSPLRLSVLTELLRIRLEFDWTQGRDDTLGTYLSQFPEISENRRALEAVAFEDFRLRSLHRGQADPQWYADRFQLAASRWRELAHVTGDSSSRPNLADETDGPIWQEAAVADELIQRPTIINRTPTFPEAGDSFGPFHLVREMGRGSFSRVFLAHQADLANRSVVLKITMLPLGESQRLARLQHSGIVPLHSVHHVGGLFALCMPMRGAVTLKDIVDGLIPSPRGPRLRDQPLQGEVPSGRWLVALIRQAHQREAQEPLDLREDLPIARLTKLDFQNAVLWIGHQVAEALHHAHQRGILHLDVKPANILIADDGQPMLLDFNLSRDHRRGRDEGARAQGGTLAYMAPEHRRAVETGVGAVGEEADVYSLGAVLYQLLTATLPPMRDPMSWQGTSSASPAQGVRRATATGSDCIHLAPSTVSILSKCLAPDRRQRYRSAAQLATDLHRQLQQRPLRYAPNPSWRERARKFARRHPRLASLGSLAVAASLVIATLAVGWMQWRRMGLELQAIQAMEQFRREAHVAEADIIVADGGTLRQGLSRGANALASYRALTHHGWVEGPLVWPLDAGRRRELFAQIGELAWLMQTAIAGEDEPLAKEVAALLDQLAPLTDLTSSSLLNGWRHFHRHQFQKALDQVQSELNRTPERFALWFLAGKCHYELRQYRQADHCFAMATWADPHAPQSYLYRAICHYWMRQLDAALEFLQEAQSRDPNWTAVFVNRALVFEQQRRFADALAQIDRALALEPGSPRWMMARSRLRRAGGDIDGADRDLEAIRHALPTDPEGWIMRGLAWLPISPDRALEDFRQAAQSRSMAAVARQNMAHVLSERLGRIDEAIAVLTELLEEFPDFSQGLAGRAVLRARQGDKAGALADADRVMQIDPSPQIHYQIGCVYALLSVQDPALAESAMRHLSRALQPAYGGQVIGSDSDLKPLERLDSFRRMKQGVLILNRYGS